MTIPVVCSLVSAVVLEGGATQPRVLMLKRASNVLNGAWCHVMGGIEPGESAWQAALREINEETGLAVARLYTLDFNEQFYEPAADRMVIAPVFVAYVDAAQPVRLNAEHSTYQWMSLADAQQRVVFGGQRRVYQVIQSEFIDRAPSTWHLIPITPNPHGASSS